MNVLALDLGTHTGWAMSERERVESGVQVFDVKRGESPGMRYLRFNRWLEEFSLGPFNLVVYEQTHNRGGAATEVAAGFATRVQEFCAKHRLQHAAVHSATLKKYTTGSGRGDKSGMAIAAINKGWLTKAQAELAYDSKLDDNEVDAICLLHYAMAELIPSSPSARS